MNHGETMKHIGDAAAGAVVLGTVVSWLPPVASLLTIIWMAIRIYESKTVQELLYGPQK